MYGVGHDFIGQPGFFQNTHDRRATRRGCVGRNGDTNARLCQIFNDGYALGVPFGGDDNVTGVAKGRKTGHPPGFFQILGKLKDPPAKDFSSPGAHKRFTERGGKGPGVDNLDPAQPFILLVRGHHPLGQTAARPDLQALAGILSRLRRKGAKGRSGSDQSRAS